MNGENINIANKPLRVLVSALDWGLGHTTRIITIVKTLQKYDVQVLIAAEGAAATLIQAELPAIQILPLKGYRIQYSRKKKDFFLKLLRQTPGILQTIKEENRWLKKAASEHKIDAVISDNRFGFYHKKIPSVYITHQLYIETGNKWLSKLAQKIHYKYINRFNQCWVPDFESGVSLAGKLSHPEKLPVIPVKYLGPLSRFVQQEENISNDLLIILSGPEPQRTIWEKEIVKQLEENKTPAILVRGLPGQSESISSSFISVYNHLTARDLNLLISQSATILSRSGYSTVMDLVALRKKAIMVPTPGQAEQEFLAGYLKEQRLFYTCNQDELQLKDIEKNVIEFPSGLFSSDFLSMNERIIKDWIDSLRASQ